MQLDGVKFKKPQALAGSLGGEAEGHQDSHTRQAVLESGPLEAAYLQVLLDQILQSD